MNLRVACNLLDTLVHNLTICQAIGVLHRRICTSPGAAVIGGAAQDAWLEVLVIVTVNNSAFCERIGHTKDREGARMRDRDIKVLQATYGIDYVCQLGEFPLDTPGDKPGRCCRNQEEPHCLQNNRDRHRSPVTLPTSQPRLRRGFQS